MTRATKLQGGRRQIGSERGFPRVLVRFARRSSCLAIIRSSSPGFAPITASSRASSSRLLASPGLTSGPCSAAANWSLSGRASPATSCGRRPSCRVVQRCARPIRRWLSPVVERLVSGDFADVGQVDMHVSGTGKGLKFVDGPVHHRCPIMPIEHVYCRDDGIRVTSPARTVFDLSKHLNATDLESVIEQGLRRSQFDIPTLYGVGGLLCRRGRPGSARFAAVLSSGPTWRRPADSHPEIELRGALTDELADVTFVVDPCTVDSDDLQCRRLKLDGRLRPRFDSSVDEREVRAWSS